VVKCREGGRTVNVCVVHAVGVNKDGFRESLGLDVVTAEDGAAWLSFIRGLVARGLGGVRLVSSDAHPGLVDAGGRFGNFSGRRNPPVELVGADPASRGSRCGGGGGVGGTLRDPRRLRVQVREYPVQNPGQRRLVRGSSGRRE